MRLILFLIAAEIGSATTALSEVRPRMADRLFCDYVADFAPQIARNRIRQVPYLRLDEFEYFDPPRSEFLRRTAREIYARPPEVLRRTLDRVTNTYTKDCRDAFEQG